MDLESLSTEKATVKVEDKNGIIHLTLSGEIDMEDPASVFRPYLNKMHSGFIQAGIKNIVIDFQAVQFMNSSGIKEFVHWILQLNNTPEENKYKVKIVYLKKITWQSSSLPVLYKLQPDLITLEGI